MQPNPHHTRQTATEYKFCARLTNDRYTWRPVDITVKTRGLIWRFFGGTPWKESIMDNSMTPMEWKWNGMETIHRVTDRPCHIYIIHKCILYSSQSSSSNSQRQVKFSTALLKILHKNRTTTELRPQHYDSVSG